MSELPPERLRTAQRVRHELKFRTLSVVSNTALTPTLRRVVLEGEDLDGFTSLGFDDHVKIFPPGRDGRLLLPQAGPNGPVFPDPRPPARDYTPRAYDAQARRLTIDFVTGHGGPATEWAERARAGDRLGVGGPRGSFVVPVDYADHVLIGDETALPAISRRLEELPAAARALAVIEVTDARSRTPLATQAQLTQVWVERGGGRLADSGRLAEALTKAAEGVDRSDAYVWIAAESQVARDLRAQALSLGFDRRAMKAAGYWRLGGEGAHDVIGDD